MIVSGKTTLCKYISYKWSLGQLLKEFDWVFMIPLKKILSSFPPTHEIVTMETILRKLFLGKNEDGGELFDEGQAKVFWRYVDHERVLFILDGYDEVYTSDNEAVNDLLQQRKYLLTSRPYSDITCNEDLSDYIVENIGFTE